MAAICEVVQILHPHARAAAEDYAQMLNKRKATKSANRSIALIATSVAICAACGPANRVVPSLDGGVDLAGESGGGGGRGGDGGGGAGGGGGSANGGSIGGSVQNRTSTIVGQVSIIEPEHDIPPASIIQGLCAEVGPFLQALPSPVSMQLHFQSNFGPAAPPRTLYAAFLQPMGGNEGPPTFSQVGDGGTTMIDLGGCGRLVDQFRVTSTDPYTVSHTLSGLINGHNFYPVDPIGAPPNIAPDSPVTRDTDMTFQSNGASGTVLIQANRQGGGVIECTGTLTATYDISHPGVPLPMRYVGHLVFSGYDAVTDAFVGTNTRVAP